MRPFLGSATFVVLIFCQETDMEDFLELLSEVSKGSSSASETSEVAVDSSCGM